MMSGNSLITKPALWGSVAFAAFLSVNGWMAMQIMDMNAALEKMSVTRFTAVDGELIRSEITDVATDIDKRLAVMENNVNWIRSMALSGTTQYEQFDNVGSALPPVPQPYAPNNQAYPANNDLADPWEPAPTPPTPLIDQPIPIPAPSPIQSPVQQQPEPIRKYDLRMKK